MNQQVIICVVIVIIILFVLTSRENYHSKNEYVAVNQVCYKANCVKKCGMMMFAPSAEDITTMKGDHCLFINCKEFPKEKCTSSEH